MGSACMSVNRSVKGKEKDVKSARSVCIEMVHDLVVSQDASDLC